LFGDIVRVTPSSKVVGDMALFMVANNLKADDILNATGSLSFSAQRRRMMQGLLGEPEGGHHGFDDVLQSSQSRPIEGRPGAAAASRLPAAAARYVRPSLSPREDVLSYRSAVFVDFMAHRQRHGDTSNIPTANFFYGLRRATKSPSRSERGKTRSSVT
jgi:pyruvate carboxylase